ncbi:MAG: alkaline phosphatase D family protein, partial [Pseudomonadota bacterium]
SACASDGRSLVPAIFSPPPETPQAALEAYYDTIPDSALPVAPAGLSLPTDDTVISKILIGSCLDEEKGESAALRTIAGMDADLFLMVGDNVYGDRNGPAYVNNDADLLELRQSFADLAARPDFQAVRDAIPMMVSWDDHDYGGNDAGGEFAFKAFAERIHERFWDLEDEDVGQWPGTYYARTFGPEGQRVQIIMLDTRFFRSRLTQTDAWGAPGKQRYVPAPEDTMQDMLGAAQWTWLENQLQEPADVRVVASSIQVMPTDHGWEAWSVLPTERTHLFDLVKKTKATGVVFLSGDRHAAFLYEEEGVLPYTATELTASSLNVSFLDGTDEIDSRQLGAGYTPENFGSVDIDWEARTLTLAVHDNAGSITRTHTVGFSDIGLK